MLKQQKANIGKSKTNKFSRIREFLYQNSMIHLWIITAILGYARKRPFLGKLVSLFSLWYGKTSWWKMFGKLRKLFVIFNALIGVLLVFNTVGFSFDNIMIGFMGLGHKYFEILGSLTNKLFTWFLNLFDKKIVPNVPNTKPGGGTKSIIDYITSPIEKGPIPKDVWNPIDTDNLPKISLRDIYMKGSPSIDITPWYKDTTTWLYLIGIGCSVGLVYIGYKLCFDPLFLDSFSFLKRDTVPTVNVDPASSNGGNSPDIELNDNVRNGLGLAIIKPISYIKKMLNPFSYVSTSTEINNQYQMFMDIQNNPVTADRNYYPFT
jgi:hypothetical protein